MQLRSGVQEWLLWKVYIQQDFHLQRLYLRIVEAFAKSVTVNNAFCNQSEVVKASEGKSLPKNNKKKLFRDIATFFRWIVVVNSEVL